MATISKKRKREASEDSSNGDFVKLVFWNHDAPALAPALRVAATFGSRERRIICGENDKIRYANSKIDGPNEENDCRYYVKTFEDPTSELQQESEGGSRLARAHLGKAFGTKKAQAAIRATERSRVDVSAMADVSDMLQATISANTGTLPQSENLKRIEDSGLHIPLFNPDARTPSEVYPLDGMVSDLELASIQPSLISADHLPFKRSVWLTERLKKSEQLRAREKVLPYVYCFTSDIMLMILSKLLFYISSMFSFRKAAFKPMERDELRGRLDSLPDPIFDCLIARFTESRRGSTVVHLTPTKETELVTQLLALCLRVDRYMCDPKVLAADLGMSLSSTQALFKSLGCLITVPTTTESSELGLPSQIVGHKLAILRVPLKLPAASKKRR
ncbi:DNA-directed RNA polymerase I subunit rpa49 [Serendipita sp. 399]|nr:DNA-directed RNA polymerase I subunit rpa49 [Serendipita sp. 399]